MDDRFDPQNTPPADPHGLTDLELEAAIGSIAARIAGLQCRFLLLAAEVDRRRLWARWGARSASAWLSWRCGVDEVTAREQLRVGRALGDLPQITTAFAEGRLSYSKVRALTRVASADDEGGWIGTATSVPAHSLVELTRAYRKATAASEHRDNAYVRSTWADDGSLVLWARLPPDQGRVLLAALDQAEDALRAGTSAQAQAATADPGSTPTLPPATAAPAQTKPPVDPAERATLPPVDSAEALTPASPGPTAVDALVLVARAALAVGPRATRAPNAYQVVLHLAADRQHLAAGPSVDDPTVRRVACDATVTALVHDERGRVRSVGRRTRRIPGPLRRAIEERDHGRCAHPGCAHRRFLDVHHVVSWLDGGRTDRDNLLLLCGYHHDALHSGRFSIEARGDEVFVFYRSDGLPFPAAPALADLPASPLRPRLFSDADPGPDVIAGHWDGERLDLDWAVAVFAGNRAVRDRCAA